MKDGPLRAGLKRVARVHFYLNVHVTRWLRRLRHGPAPYTLGGACRGCASCCEAPAIRASAAVWYLRSLRRAFLGWQEHVNGFVLVHASPGSRTFVFRCTHFDAGSRRCDSYATRPGMCRDYPRGLLEQPSPELFAGCGYRPVTRGRESWVAALRARGVDEGQLEKLKKGLFLE